MAGASYLASEEVQKEGEHADNDQDGRGDEDETVAPVHVEDYPWDPFQRGEPLEYHGKDEKDCP